jgi:hypothetical protein
MILFQWLLNKSRLAKINPFELITLAVLICIFKNINPMWIHPDSMTAGGLRLISGEWSTFHFATYGPFAFIVSGVMNGLLFPLGLAIGAWKTKASFEEAYRTNHIEVISASFTNFSMLINLILIFLSLKFLTKIFSVDSNRRLQSLNLFLLFLAIPISLNQLTLDTIEIYTFFGISVALYVSFLQIRRQTAPKFFDYSLVTASFLLTIGMRISLAIFIIPVYLFIAFQQYRKNKLFSEFAIPFVASLVTLTSYLPLILNYVELKLSIEMYRSLGSLDFGAETLSRNFVVLMLNSGVLLFLFLPTLILTLREFVRKDITAEQALLLIWFLLAFLHLSLYLFNLNGFPKYLIPVFPIFLLLIDRACSLETLNQLKYLRAYKKSIVVLISFTYTILGIANYNDFQTHSGFDTREVIMQVLPDADGWMEEATANITVITELSRGKYGFTYEEVINRISPFAKGGSECKKLLILSTRELSVKQMSDATRMCGYETGEYSIIEISPYLDSSANESSDEWLGFLSLGTPVDSNRKGFGPHYEMFFQKDWTYATDLLANCASSQYCRIIQN